MKGQAIMELTLSLSLILLVIFSGIKICIFLQKSFKHDFVEKHTGSNNGDFEISFSKNLIFFKNAKERREFKENHDPSSSLTFKELGIIL